MIILDNYTSKIDDFILKSVRKFKMEHGNPNSVGVYCCPWSGWLTTNFNLRKSLKETNHSCPDFEFVEYDLLDFPGWQEEYETSEPMYQLGNEIIQFNHEQGDEELNKVFFSFMLPIITETATKIKHKILLQFLDSNCSKIVETD